MWVRIIYIRNCIKRKAECITTLQGAKLMCMLESGWTNMFHFMTSTCVFLEKCLRSFTYFYNFLFININQLDALNFIISLFHASTCFEHHVLIVRRSKLYYTVSGIITPIGGRPVLSAVLLKIQVFGMWRCFIGRTVTDVSKYRNFFSIPWSSRPRRTAAQESRVYCYKRKYQYNTPKGWRNCDVSKRRELQTKKTLRHIPEYLNHF